MTDNQQRNAAKEFADYWKDKGYEKGQSQPFWMALLRDVYGVEHPEEYISFEDQVKIDSTSFIDGYIDNTHVLIEQKSLGKDLNASIVQSDKTKLTPFQQAKRYSAELPYDKRPRWIVTCNFEEFFIYDMNTPSGEPQKLLLRDLEHEYYRLTFLVDTADHSIEKETKVSIQAGELVGIIYDAFAKQYRDMKSEESQKSLNKLCVRLVFCMYAEDAGLFIEHGKFHKYMEQYPTKDCRRALIDLFKVLDTKIEDRDPYMDAMLASFPYVNGGLFADENIEIPQFTDEIRTILLTKASENFNWSDISPTIFGAVFEATLNPETRRLTGSHYTSIENILKVTSPLFLDGLKEELSAIKAISVDKTKITKLKKFQNKLASLVFLDPAAGSGNFLTQTYIDLRILENEVIRMIADMAKGAVAGQISFADKNNCPIQVSIGQFYGIEINDFAVAVAQTALWIAENQMMKKTEDILHMDFDFLPLKSYSNIHEGNALVMNWEDAVSIDNLDYIMGNPPFVGIRHSKEEHRKDLKKVTSIIPKAGSLDYVTGWYIKASEIMKYNPDIETAFVSTNSIIQGEQAYTLWHYIIEDCKQTINFAYQTFIWKNEAKDQAAVHCVIIGFSRKAMEKRKLWIKNQCTICDNINQYLMPASTIWVNKRNKPLANIPELQKGCYPTDGGNYIFTRDEKDEFINKEPMSSKYFRRWIGSEDILNDKERYILFLKNCPPEEIKKMPLVKSRIIKVKEMRRKSTKLATQKKAETPTLLDEERIPSSRFLVIPVVSSANRQYIPIDYRMPPDICYASCFFVENADLLLFGIMMSNVHNDWMRIMSGKLKSDYRYSNTIVYNNFPWPTPNDSQKKKIEQTAQEILDVRERFPNSSLAVLYDPSSMPPALKTAHQHNDKAVMQAYGFKESMTEAEVVAELMKMYQELTKDDNNQEEIQLK